MAAAETENAESGSSLALSLAPEMTGDNLSTLTLFLGYWFELPNPTREYIKEQTNTSQSRKHVFMLLRAMGFQNKMKDQVFQFAQIVMYQKRPALGILKYSDVLRKGLFTSEISFIRARYLGINVICSLIIHLTLQYLF